MQYFIKKLFFIPLLFIPFTAIAAPSLTGISGTTTNDETVTLTGSSFGTKTTAAPLIWDNFENGVNAAELNTTSWTNYNTRTALFSNAQAYSGSLAAWNEVDDSVATTEFRTNYIIYTATDEAYCMYKYRWSYKNGSDLDGTGKLSRLTTNESDATAYGPPNMKIETGDQMNWWYASYHNGTEYTQQSVTSLKGQAGNWVTIEMYNKLDTSAGEIFIRFNNADTWSETSINTRNSGETFQFTTFWLGLGFANARNSTDYDFYIDDVYVDNTQSRVVLGDNQTYSSCTVLEVQPQTAHSATGITITFNPGSFATDDTAYLFVIDEDGNVSNALEVTIGGGSTPSTGKTIISGNALVAGPFLISN